MEAAIATVPQTKNAMTEVASSRQAQEVQAAVLMARKFPRDTTMALTRILEDCKRIGLAERAVYEYARGGTKVTGPSIRLAETLARSWGNMDCGIVELERKGAQGNLAGESIMQAFAWDLETNTRITKVFSVKHWRDTKQGGYALKDERDIYEIAANNGARRLRACILGIIPTDIVEQAIEQCEKTMKGGQGPLIDRVRAMVMYFKDQFNVSQDMIEKRLMHNIDAISEIELVSLKRIATSLKDNMADRSDFFDIGGTPIIGGSHISAPAEVAQPSAAPQTIKVVKNFAPQAPEEAATWEPGDFNEEVKAMPPPTREEIGKRIAKEQKRLGYGKDAVNHLISEMFHKSAGQLTVEEMLELAKTLEATVNA